MTGSLDNTTRLWDLNTAKCLNVMNLNESIREIELSHCANYQLIQS